jgi:RNA polymerase sigma factor (sigma-70 family)
MSDGELTPVLRHVRQVAGAAGDARTDGQMLTHFATDRDEAAFRTLVQRHGPMVLGVCRRVLQQRQDAEDAFQATFLLLARRATAIRKRDSVASWLHGAAYRLALKARAQAARRRAREQQVVPRRTSEPALEAAWRELRAVLDEEMQRLPEKYRTPLVLFHLENQTHEEVARHLGHPVGTVKSLLSRGRDRLRARLARRGLGLSAPALVTAFVAEEASAAVPAALAEGALRAAGGAPSATAAALAGAGTLLTVKLRLAIAAALLLGILGGGVGWLAHQPASTKPPVAEAPGKPAPVAKAADQPAQPDEVPLPPGARVRMGSLRLRHGDRIASVAFAPDGKLLATGGEDQALRLWDPATGREVHTLRGQGALATVAFAPRGGLLAWASGKAIHLWDMASRQQRAPLTWELDEKAKGRPGPLVFSPDGTTVAIALPDHTVRVWDVPSEKSLQVFPRQEDPVHVLTFTPDGKTLLAATRLNSGCTLLRWDVATGREVAKYVLAVPEGQRLLGHTFSPDGATLATEVTELVRQRQGNQTHVFTEYKVVPWDTGTGRERFPLEAQTSVVWAVAFSPDGKTVAWARMDNCIGVADAVTGQTRHWLAGYPGGTRPDGWQTLAFSPDGKTLAAVGMSAAVHLWDVTTGQELRLNAAGHQDAVTALTFTPDGRTLLSGSLDHTIHVWDPATGRLRRYLEGHADGVSALALSPDGTTVASSSRDGVLRLWELATGKERRAIQAVERTAGVYSGFWPLAFTADGQRLVSWGDDYQFRIWNVATGEGVDRHVPVLSGLPNLPPARPRSSPPGSLFVGARISPDGRTAALATNTAIYLVDPSTGRELRKLPGHGGPTCLAFSADSRTLASGGWDHVVRLWDVADGKERLKIEGLGHVNSVALAPDGRRVAAVQGWTDGVIDLFDTATGKRVDRLQGYGSYAGALAFSADGTRLASGQRDTTVLVWDVRPTRP